MVTIPKPRGLSKYEDPSYSRSKDPTVNPFIAVASGVRGSKPEGRKPVTPLKKPETAQEYIEAKAEPEQQKQIKQAEIQLVKDVTTARKSQQVMGLAKYEDPNYKRSNLMRLAGSYAAYQQSYQRGYRSLTPKEKQEYGYRYTEWEKIPAEEVRYYPGGKRYLSEHKEELTTRYIEEKGGLEKIPLDPFFYASYQAKYGYKPPRSPEVIRMQAGEQLLYSPEEQRSRQYGRLPLYSQLITSGFGATVRTVASPVVLGQTAVKFVTGKTIGFDVGAGLQNIKLGPSGLIEGTISEGVGVVTGRGPGDFEKMKQNPLGTIAATGGEVLGMLMLSGTIRGAKPYVASSFKSTIRYTPKFYSQFQKVFPKPVVLESGKQVGSPVLSKLYSGVSRIGGTDVYQNVYGYATGRLSFVKTLPLKSQSFYQGSRTGIDVGRTNVFQVTRKFGGFPRTRLVPSAIGKRYVVGDVVSFSDGLVQHTVMKPPKGFIFKKTETYTSMFRRIDDGFTNIAGDVSKSPFVRGGFFRNIDDVATAKYLKVEPSKFVRSGFARQENKIDMLITKKGFKGFISSEDALTPVAPQIQVSSFRPTINFGKSFGSFGKLAVNIPSSIISMGYLPASGLFIGSVLAQELSSNRISVQTPRVDMKPISLNISISDVLSESLPASISLSGLNQVQLQRQQQALKLKTITIPQQTFPKTTLATNSFVRGQGSGRIRLKYIPDDDFGFSLKKMKFKPMKLTTGYRERTWKVPTLRQLLGA